MNTKNPTENGRKSDVSKLLRDESPDVFSHIPAQFLSKYRSYCWRRDDGELLCLPSVYLSGMPKCGSTDFYDKLVWHPDLVRPTWGKENHYWARSRLGKPTDHLLQGGTRSKNFSTFLHDLGPERVERHPTARLVDGTQSMLWDLKGWEARYPGHDEPPYSNADLLHEVTPEAKVLVITRDPVERLYSDYLFFNSENSQNKTASSFDAAVRLELGRFETCLLNRDLRTCCYDSKNNPKLRLHLGVYICYIRDWKQVFGDEIMVISLEDYSSHPQPTLIRIFNFLGVSKPDNEKLRAFLHGSKKSNSRRKSALLKGDMLPQTRKILQEFYGPYNRELARYLQDTRFLYKY